MMCKKLLTIISCISICVALFAENSFSADLSNFDVFGIKLGDDIHGSLDKVKGINEYLEINEQKGIIKTQYYSTGEILFSFKGEVSKLRESEEKLLPWISLVLCPSHIKNDALAAISYQNYFSTSKDRKPLLEDVVKSLVDKYGSPDAKFEYISNNYLLWATKPIPTIGQNSTNSITTLPHKLAFFNSIHGIAHSYGDGSLLSNPIHDNYDKIFSMGKILLCEIKIGNNDMIKNAIDNIKCTFVDGEEIKSSVLAIKNKVDEETQKSVNEDIANRKKRDIKL